MFKPPSNQHLVLLFLKASVCSQLLQVAQDEMGLLHQLHIFYFRPQQEKKIHQTGKYSFKVLVSNVEYLLFIFRTPLFHGANDNYKK